MDGTDEPMRRRPYRTQRPRSINVWTIEAARTSALLASRVCVCYVGIAAATLCSSSRAMIDVRKASSVVATPLDVAVATIASIANYVLRLYVEAGPSRRRLPSNDLALD